MDVLFALKSKALLLCGVLSVLLAGCSQPGPAGSPTHDFQETLTSIQITMETLAKTERAQGASATSRPTGTPSPIATLTPVSPHPGTATATPTPTSTHLPGSHSGWTTFAITDDILEGRRFQAIAVAHDSAVWLGTDNGLFRVTFPSRGVNTDPVSSTGDDLSWERYDTSDGLVDDNVLSLAVGRAGEIWIGTERGLGRFVHPDGGTNDAASWATFKVASGDAYQVRDIALTLDGAPCYIAALRVHCFDGQNWAKFDPYGGALTRFFSALAIAPDDAIWLGTYDGVWRQADPTGGTGDGETLTLFGVDDGLVYYFVTSATVGADGALWFGTSAGASRYDGQSWTSFTTADGLVNNDVRDIALAPDGALWFVTANGVSRYMPEGQAAARVSPTPVATLIPTYTPTPTSPPTLAPSPMPNPVVTPLPAPLQRVIPVGEVLLGEFQALHISPEGNLWLLTDQGAAQEVDGVWTAVLSDFAGSLVGIGALDRVWAVSDDASQISAWDGASWTHYGPDQGWTPLADTWYRYVDSPVTDGMGRLWISTSQDMRAFDGERWTVYTPEDMGMGPAETEGLVPGWVVTVMDETGQVWVGECDWGGPGPFGGRGARWFDGQTWHGADSPIANGCANAIATDAAGRVWIGVDSGLWRYDPKSGEWTELPPPESPDPEQRFGFVADLFLDRAGDPWPILTLCGGASCYGDDVLYHIRGDIWTHVIGGGQYPGQVLVFDAAGVPWLFWGGTLFRLVGGVPEPVANIVVRSMVVGADGQVWLVARHEGRDLLLFLDTASAD